jgi:hypothetical protein
MTCHDIEVDAAGLAALHAGDPERRAAFAHAEGCVTCQAALAEATGMLRALDADLAALAERDRPSAATLERMSRDLLRQFEEEDAAAGTVAAAGAAELDRARAAPAPSAGERARPAPTADPGDSRRRPTRAQTPISMPVVGGRRPLGRLGPAAVLASVMVATGIGKLWLAHPVGPGAGTSRASALLVMLGSVVVTGSLTLGLWLAAAFPLGSIALSVADAGPAAAQAAIGIRCAGFELMFAALPVLVAAGLYGRPGHASTRLPKARWAMVAAAGGGSFVAQSVLHHICHAQPSLVHNLGFHTLPLLLAMGAASWVGARLRTERRL